MPYRWGSALVLFGLVLLYFFPLVVHPTGVLYSEASDLIAEHIPAKQFLVRSFQQTGELPLWCPLQFAGSPFVHDIQVAMFYPPHLLLLVLPESAVGTFVSWLVVLHLFLAGFFMLAYARQRGLLPIPSLIAAVGFMFASRWMLHLLGGGHYITIGLAWLPLVLLCFDRAILSGSWRWSTLGAVAFALIALSTQPQWTFYAGLLTAFAGLGTVLFPHNSPSKAGVSPTTLKRLLARWLAHGVWLALVGLALAAVQLMPTLESIPQSSRASGIAPELPIESLRTLPFLVGPSLIGNVPFLMWEDRGGLTLLWLLCAVLAPLLRSGWVRYHAGVCLVMIFVAIFGAFLSKFVPGFHLFRQHPRILVVAGLPIALLVGSTTQSLFFDSPRTLASCGRRTGVLLALVLVALLAMPLSIALGRAWMELPLRFDWYWVVMPFTLVCGLWLVATRPDRSLRVNLALWCTILLVDLWALSWPLVDARSSEAIYTSSSCVELLSRSSEGVRVLDVEQEDENGATLGSPLGQGSPLAIQRDLQTIRGYNPIDVRRYREFLAFIGDNPGPLRALDSETTFPTPLNFPLVNRELLDFLNVQWVLHPEDWSLDGSDWSLLLVDEQATGYSLARGGLLKMSNYHVSRNNRSFPRAFVVPRAIPSPPAEHVLETLKRTNLRETVLIEGLNQEIVRGSSTGFQSAELISAQPNRVQIALPGGSSGFLVLSDVWYPGWKVTVDGSPAPLYRANHAFRAVEIPEGARIVVFSFEPSSYFVGRTITLATLVFVSFLLIGLTIRQPLRPRSV